MMQQQQWIFAQAKEFLHDAVTFSTNKKPSVTVTYAQSQDNMIAKQNEQLILSGAESMAMTHRLRAMHDGILVGINTVLCDDPRLNVRLVPENDVHGSLQPIVLDSHLQIPTSARLITSTEGKKPWVFTSDKYPADKRKELESLGVRVIVVPTNEPCSGGNALCLTAVVDELYVRGIRRLMVEGGASVICAFLRSQIPENLVVTTAPVTVGDGGVRVVSVDDADSGFSMVSPKYRTFGNDVVMATKLEYS
ncbi:2,5-diamino-6-(ribosylamino)-4(3H)-pyrimidinone 5'-phosphate reductase [Coemansia sp. RSA 1646]|nr:2,5-diamino-6-(ribosylamino)-4(3H)-pyrimidinone 5'-phosphate reductase [Coemansia sp. RSA 1646]KAJ1769213.1 2,5-diamino-6-(ribosylamino)-4(3H)-pyrimidinone 5'-phosphate reductase [Coemansia sp. RSA 1843]KAJ2214506.1 2,5-diamino-6-(ribosylamino)-4(3H)-pyrimidinone 5'-phosphate reductase [Coemansia sp. RSA 487]